MLLLSALSFLTAASTCLAAATPPTTGQRPVVQASPKTPRLPIPNPPARTKTCTITSRGNGLDDSANILAAFHDCNNGGHVVFSQDTTYTVGTAMDWTFLQHIDIDIRGTIKFTDDTNYWQANAFKFGFQNATSFFKLGGNDVFIYGGGTLDGSGQAWYDLYASNIYILRPVLVGIDGLQNSIISHINLRYSPQYYTFMTESQNVVFDNINISGKSTSKNPAKNTDGWDTYRSSDISILNSVVDNGDDCVSFKPNSTFILVQSVSCTGSHGISVGSLGQYPDEYDIVSDIYVSQCSLTDSTSGARIKVWPGAPARLSGDLQGGGGAGHVNNITYDGLTFKNVDYAMEITQCYGQRDLNLCQQNPSKATIEGVVFKDFKGMTSAKHQPNVGSLTCSSTEVCNGIQAMGNTVTSPKGGMQAYCFNMDQKLLDVTCTTTAS